MPQPFTDLTAVAAVLLRDNIDTDAIIPSREIRAVAKTGLADGLFANWRYLPGRGRTPDPEFVLNSPACQGSQTLITGENLGCGSSREQAVWALAEYGFRALIAPSFNTIFHRNCVRNGVLPARLASGAIARLAAWVIEDPQRHRPLVSLVTQRIIAGNELSTRALRFLKQTEERQLNVLEFCEYAETLGADLKPTRPPANADKPHTQPDRLGQANRAADCALAAPLLPESRRLPAPECSLANRNNNRHLFWQILS